MKTLYILAPNKRQADKFMEHWSPDGWIHSIEHGGCFPTIEKALKDKKKSLDYYNKHIIYLKTPEGEARRMELVKAKLNGWGSWTAERIQKEMIDKINLYQVFEYQVDTFGDAFKRATP